MSRTTKCRTTVAKLESRRFKEEVMERSQVLDEVNREIVLREIHQSVPGTIKVKVPFNLDEGVRMANVIFEREDTVNNVYVIRFDIEKD